MRPAPQRAHSAHPYRLHQLLIRAKAADTSTLTEKQGGAYHTSHSTPSEHLWQGASSQHSPRTVRNTAGHRQARFAATLVLASVGSARTSLNNTLVPHACMRRAEISRKACSLRGRRPPEEARLQRPLLVRQAGRTALRAARHPPLPGGRQSSSPLACTAGASPRHTQHRALGAQRALVQLHAHEFMEAFIGRMGAPRAWRYAGGAPLLAACGGGARAGAQHAAPERQAALGTAAAAGRDAAGHHRIQRRLGRRHRRREDLRGRPQHRWRRRLRSQRSRSSLKRRSARAALRSWAAGRLQR